MNNETHQTPVNHEDHAAEQYLPPLESSPQANTQEQPREVGHERAFEQGQDQDSSQQQQTVGAPSPQTVQPTQGVQPSNTASTGATRTMPQVADDIDVIEKEWVDKAKEVIETHKSDPYALEQEFEKLQIEYHKKRYGRDIKPKRG